MKQDLLDYFATKKKGATKIMSHSLSIVMSKRCKVSSCQNKTSEVLKTSEVAVTEQP